MIQPSFRVDSEPSCLSDVDSITGIYLYFKKINRLLPLVLLISFFLASCETKKEHTEEKTIVKEKAVSAPVFLEDSAYKRVADQVAFGPRVPNSVAHVKCGDYMIDVLKSLKVEVKIQEFDEKSFDGKPLRLRNIVGTINPAATKRILLITHWDTRPFADKDSINKNKPIDGANDGASGVGILLEIARAIQQASAKPSVGVDLLFVDGEDGGRGHVEGAGEEGPDTWCLGAQFWSKQKHVPGYSAFYGILLDMVGAKGAHFAMEGTSMQYAPEVNKMVWETAHRAGFGTYFIFQKVESIVDDHAYINEVAKIPTIDIIDFDVQKNSYFGWYHHTHSDNMSIIDPQTLKAVGQTVLNVLYNEQ